RSEMEAYQKLGIKALNINNGIAVKTISPLPAIRSNTSKFRILTCARIVHQKNPALFNSIARYFKDFDQFEFVWVGDGEERHLLTSPNIIITGWLSPPEAQKLITSSDLYLSTSQYEGLSFSVLEALALQKTVLLKDCI